MGIEVDILEKWEYTSIKTEAKGFLGGILDISYFDNELNILGEQGWELVSCFSTTKMVENVEKLSQFLKEGNR